MLPSLPCLSHIPFIFDAQLECEMLFRALFFEGGVSLASDLARAHFFYQKDAPPSLSRPGNDIQLIKSTFVVPEFVVTYLNHMIR